MQAPERRGGASGGVREGWGGEKENSARGQRKTAGQSMGISTSSVKEATVCFVGRRVQTTGIRIFGTTRPPTFGRVRKRRPKTRNMIHVAPLRIAYTMDRFKVSAQGMYFRSQCVWRV